MRVRIDTLVELVRCSIQIWVLQLDAFVITNIKEKIKGAVCLSRCPFAVAMSSRCPRALRKEVVHMEEFVFGSFAQLLKDTWRGRTSQVNIARILYDAVLDSVSDPKKVKSEAAIPDSKSASKLFLRDRPVHNDVISHKDDPDVLAGIEVHFEDNVVSALEESKIEGLLRALKLLIQESDRPQGTKDRLLEIADTGSLAGFLSQAYLESLARSNKKDAIDKRSKRAAIPRFDPASYDAVDVPKEISPEESVYIRAILDAYADKEGLPKIEIEFVEDSDEYREHFKRQRKDYFNADFVRHSTRGSSDAEGHGPFNDLQQEIHDGIIDVYEDDYDNGFERLKACLRQVPKVQVARSWINADDRWLSASVKKGVCHILVNDRVLKGWVKRES